MPKGEYVETIHYRYIKCDAIGCRTWRYYPLAPKEKGWFDKPVCAFGTTLHCCLCPDHRGELHRLAHRETNRHHRKQTIYIYIYTPTPLCGLQRRRIASLLPPLWSPTLENCAAHCARHARHNERTLPKVLYKHAWDSIDAEAEALQLGEMCGVGHLLLNDGD